MRVGVFALLNHPGADREAVLAAGRAADACGFHSLWIGEHAVLFDDYRSAYPYAPDGQLPLPREAGMLELFTTLAFLAACTERIRLASGICILPQRNPVLTAKEAANVDWLSGGRLDLGLGIGWSRQEFEALGAEWPRRAARSEEYVALMKRLWCEELSSFEGEFYRLAPCRMHPKPVQKPHPPLYFGGNSEAALGRVARLGDGWLALGLSPEDLARHRRQLGKLLEREGRSLAQLDVAVMPPPGPLDRAHLARYRDAGATQLVAAPARARGESLAAAIERLAAALLPL